MHNRPLTYDESLRILLDGVCGPNDAEIRRGTGLSRPAVRGFFAGHESRADTMEKLGMFVWRKLNASVLLSEVELGYRRD